MVSIRNTSASHVEKNENTKKSNFSIDMEQVFDLVFKYHNEVIFKPKAFFVLLYCVARFELNVRISHNSNSMHIFRRRNIK